jgi:ppGpp synthetase/RelA/SpoT-type nucleotidyltranferase
VILPDSFVAAFDTEMSVVEATGSFSESRLRLLCDAHHWLFDSRFKEPQSALAKLEAGSFESLPEMNDLYAATIVVPTHRSVRDAITAVSEEFDVAKGPQRTQDPLTFPYDDVHLIASLGTKVSPPSMPEVVRLRQFEIQVRTGLQYAWWRATHDTVYKGVVRDWGSQRVASQARAALELLDGVLANIAKSAELQTVDSPLGDPPEPVGAEWILLWREADRPEDLARFCSTVDAIISTTTIEPGAIRNRLESDGFREIIEQDQMTPIQVVLLAVCQLDDVEPWIERFRQSGKRLLLTPECLRAGPELGAVPGDLRVAI